nr:MAG TPA: hypothetical protein [Caudoviricetes sp.]
MYSPLPIKILRKQGYSGFRLHSHSRQDALQRL